MVPIVCAETSIICYQLSPRNVIEEQWSEAWNLVMKKLFRKWFEDTDETQKLWDLTLIQCAYNSYYIHNQRHMRSTVLAKGKKKLVTFIQINQPKRCNSFTSLLLDVYAWLNMFRGPPRPSSETYNCTRSLWFYRWSVAVGALLVVVCQTTTNNAPAASFLR